MAETTITLNSGEVGMLDHYQTDLRAYLRAKIGIFKSMHGEWPTGIQQPAGPYPVSEERRGEIGVIFREVLDDMMKNEGG